MQTGFDTDIEAGGTGSVAVVDGTIPVLRFYETHGAAIGKWCVALAKSDEDGVVDTLTANFDPVP
ncbi:MAG: hypothetical protein H6925_04945 [Holosporaceae bacterium]|nr:MAG: hypothetical protein H6925_04945 [Holosporaceae bacterium]